jgi:putative glutathione S-transferase
VDVPTGQVVTNDFEQITVDLSTEWTKYHRPGAPQLYPEHRRAEIDEVDDVVFRDVNNGVYRAGFASTQAAYDEAYRRLFDRLDWLSDRLASRRYLVGDTITEADVHRPHQTSLLRGAPGAQPERYRPGRPGSVRVDDPARPRITRWPPVW